MQGIDKINPQFNKWLQALSSDPIACISGLACMAMAAVMPYLGKKVADNLPGIINDAFSRLTLIGIQWFSPCCFTLRYKRQVLFGGEVSASSGLSVPGIFALAGEKTYIQLNLSPCLPPNKPACFRGKALQGSRPIWAFLPEKQALAVIGVPGGGKSALLRHIAVTFAANRQLMYQATARTPMWLSLRGHVGAIMAGQMDLAQLAQAHFSNQNRYPGLNPPAQWFAKQLHKGKAIVLLDGLADIADTATRRCVALWIDRQISHYRHCLFVVTSRPEGYWDTPLQHADCLEILPLAGPQVRELACRWYGQQALVEADRTAGERKADELLACLRHPPALDILKANPLLLTMLALVYSRHQQVPEQRVALFAQTCALALGQGRAGGFYDNLTAAQKQIVLQPLAAAMRGHYQSDITEAEALRLIAEPLRRLGFDSQILGGQFLTAVAAHSGLLVGDAAQGWRFAHLALQDYLTACHWLAYPPDQTWQALVTDNVWHETLRFYSAQANASAIVRACLQQNTWASLSLASDCADVALAVDEPVLQALRTTLAENVVSGDTGLRQLAANVRLNNRLKTLQTLNRQTEITAGWISCAEYQLFVDATGGIEYPADCVPNKAQQAVLGIKAADAQAFCLWLSQKTGQHYRLPTMSEAQQGITASPQPPYAVWCWEQSNYALVWQDVSQYNRYLRQLSDLHPLAVRFGYGLLKKPGDRAAIALYLAGYFYSLDLERGFDSDFDPGLCPASEQILDLTPLPTPSRSQDRALVYAIAHAFEHVRSLDFSLDCGLNLGYMQGLERVMDIKLAKQCIPDLKEVVGRLGMSPLAPLFKELLAAIESPQANGISIRQAARAIILYDLDVLLTVRWEAFCRQLNFLLTQQKRLLFWRKAETVDSELLKETLLAWFWAYKITAARSEGLLPAWEGIKIVRERGGYGKERA